MSWLQILLTATLIIHNLCFCTSYYTYSKLIKNCGIVLWTYFCKYSDPYGSQHHHQLGNNFDSIVFPMSCLPLCHQPSFPFFPLQSSLVLCNSKMFEHSICFIHANTGKTSWLTHWQFHTTYNTQFVIITHKFIQPLLATTLPCSCSVCATYLQLY